MTQEKAFKEGQFLDKKVCGKKNNLNSPQVKLV